ncbi:MAG: kynureninase [Asgard group archaeon]|nr:kynureninase [Asgard group archaeon]
MKEINKLSREYAKQLDQNDSLASFRKEFYIPKGSKYVDGNSLGLCCKEVEKALLRVLTEWKEKGIKGWFSGKIPWFYFSEKLGEMIAPLVGAEKDEVIATGTTTVNLHALVSSFYQPKKSKTKILADVLNFPTDIYALRSQIALKGYDPDSNLVLVPSEDGRTLDEKTIIEHMTNDIALIVLPSVLYRSGQLLDIELLVEEAHKRNILIGFDCSHSVGAIPHYFDKWEVDFAFWCSYKYLNGGPGSPAFLYVNKKHFNVHPGLAGWFGNKKETQFDMSLDFEPAGTAGQWQISSPTMLGAAAIQGSLKIIKQAGIKKIREKSLVMTNYLITLVETKLREKPYNCKIRTPKDDKQRGGHIAIECKHAEAITKALQSKGVIPDYRPPNIIRIAPTALYNTFEEIWEIVNIIQTIIDEKTYNKFAT